jgi:hypothetical protein
MAVTRGALTSRVPEAIIPLSSILCYYRLHWKVKRCISQRVADQAGHHEYLGCTQGEVRDR